MVRSCPPILGLSLGGVGMILVLGFGRGPAPTSANVEAPTLPGTMLVRDFRRHDMTRGHPDFFVPVRLAVDTGLLERRLDISGRPRLETAHDSTSIHDARSFASWFRDSPGTNMSRLVPVRFQLEDDAWVFDSSAHAPWMQRGGFFPIDGALYGNHEGLGGAHNWHFTATMRVSFEFDPSRPMVIEAAADGDLWIFVDGELVIDLGGAHPFRGARRNLADLPFESGGRYEIAVFYANRRPAGSELRLKFDFPVHERRSGIAFAPFD